ncbi:indolepyruvate ferredoxin oxidoreductase family protein [Paraburkholderia silvatlantica]|uniref:Indolepyruvate ferredoxin oxidoreductase n=1 Tax=Paraburkholderia silvatlantica TaxID=321895 RepID=A0ABR6FX20_9BURK|nr:indolepyruvate ferredoxin oxidoreductase family protein [Paraburkholderia silvatlantica]MBB2931588.1 indolepyruvate ferredoxin oxidoreductase [Paraburkholderia silvatlantica]PVY26621.1 indolepyruvate ferredoxin oxidoreductase [Paraburkholderia silvatlantica]PXW32886.1 indolepyruvate ferredoxin oxidoreductase [Paraburkholderia silvatlantica]
MTLRTVTLDDKYTLDSGRIFLTGVQALVRLPLMQHRRDKANGLNTAGYVSGYRGSPLGTYDAELGKASKFLKAANVVFVPGVNEDLAATAVWGTQQAEVGGEGKYDGVFSIWYGKGPGVDRSGDAFRHANLAGSSKQGGVLLLMGDDHTCESSTTCHQSEFALVDASIPILSPSGVQEIIDYGLYGWAMSRYSGCWVGLKCVKDTADASAAIDVDLDRVTPQLPTSMEMPAGGLNLRHPDTPQEQEFRLHNYKLDAVRAFVRVNGLDRVTLGKPGARLGIVTHGKSYLDLLQAIDDLNVTEADLESVGVAIYKVACTWPLEPQGIQAFASGLDLLMVVEEKRSLLESQIKDILYREPHAPVVIGKHDESGKKLFAVEMSLNSLQIAIALGQRLVQHADGKGIAERLELLMELGKVEFAPEAMLRSFYFCSGCPHNSSTVIPEGSKAYAGIGCSWMAQTMDRNTMGYTQMGAEGMAWVGEAPFSRRGHMFQNMGDGTYFHSGLLAVRAAVAARTNITFKILYNDAVAMTGGQRHDGQLSPMTITTQVHSEGVSRIAVVSDDPSKYPADAGWARGVTIHHRSELQKVQEQLRDVPGVTVLVYDQTCAAENRRRRKRNQFPDPAKRLVINDLVCEGCGDCGVKSNCVSLVPLETEHGRKRAIDQSACNKDFSCNNGFCPSFVTVLGGSLRKAGTIRPNIELFPALVEPELPSVENGVYSIIVTGVGGTGVVTIGAILGMAAHLEGKGCGILDMAGLAQKGGSVWSHLRFGKSPSAIKAIRIAVGGADAVLGCDMVVAASRKTLAATRKGATRMLINTHEVMTGEFTRHPDLTFPAPELRKGIADAVGRDRVEFVDATKYALNIFGDTIAGNMFMLGYAYQRGLIPIGSEAINAAIELNGAGVKMNKEAFLWGRRAAQSPASAERVLAAAKPVNESVRISSSLDEFIERKVKFLTAYQNAAYGERFRRLVGKVRDWERTVMPRQETVTRTVASGYFKVLAYKDEYEVARLHASPEFVESIKQQFEGDFRIAFNLAPPLFARKDELSGEPRKKEYGAWILPAFRMLAKMKVLRGTAFDVFGYTVERRLERGLIYRYEQTVDEILRHGTARNYQTAVRAAGMVEKIRGYGHVKERNLKSVDVEWTNAVAQLSKPTVIEVRQVA